jgi:signal transduction histidine kinase
VRFTVEDLGAGIAPDQLRELFQRFDVRNAAGRRRIGGLGMGLAFVRAVAEQHGGKVGAQSVPGRTTVWMEVPSC